MADRPNSAGDGPRRFIRRPGRTGAIGRALLALALTVAFAVPITARAAESNRFVSREDTVSVVARNNRASGSALRLGLLFRLSKGWHIYWKNPGDVGSPPELSLTQPAAAAVAFDWPAPEWLITNGLGDYVLSGTVLLPFTLKLAHAVPPSGIDLRGSARWLVCGHAICVPQHAAFTLHLPRGNASRSAESALFVSARAVEPRASPFEATISPDAVLTVTGKGLYGANIRAAHFYPDRANAIVNAARQRLDVHAAGLSLTLKPHKWSIGSPLTGILEITDRAGRTQAFTIAARPAHAGDAARGATSLGSGWTRFGPATRVYFKDHHCHGAMLDVSCSPDDAAAGMLPAEFDARDRQTGGGR